MKLDRIVSRPVENSAWDYALLRKFVQQQPGMASHGANCTPGDLDWWICTDNNPDKLLELQLWLDGERVIGWAWPHDAHGEVFLHPRYAGLLPEMVAWMEESARGRDAATVTIVANDRDLPRQKALFRAGFERTDDHYVYRRRSLQEPIEEPTLPAGFLITDMKGAGEDEISQRVELHRAVWAPSKMTVEKHRAVMASSTYRADLDLIAVAPNGELAAYTIVWHDPVTSIGVFEPVGCHPDYRRRGLTSAVMREGLRLLRERGAGMAFVNSWHASEPANRLYESLGFELVDRQRKWTKALG